MIGVIILGALLGIPSGVVLGGDVWSALIGGFAGVAAFVSLAAAGKARRDPYRPPHLWGEE